MHPKYKIRETWKLALALKSKKDLEVIAMDK